MTMENLDLQTILLIAGAALAVIILLLIVLRATRRRQSIQQHAQFRVEQAPEDPYAAVKERPYVKPPAPAGVTTAPPPSPAPASPPPAPPPPPPPPPAPPADRAAPAVEPGSPSTDDDAGVSQPAVPLPGDLAGIAFPPRSTDHRDELTRLKGVGPKLAAMLNEEGITRYEQLASLDEAELTALDAKLGNFKGRLARDRVVEQARLLASGDRAEYEARFGKLGGS